MGERQAIYDELARRHGQEPLDRLLDMLERLIAKEQEDPGAVAGPARARQTFSFTVSTVTPPEPVPAIQSR